MTQLSAAREQVAHLFSSHSDTKYINKIKEN